MKYISVSAAASALMLLFFSAGAMANCTVSTVPLGFGNYDPKSPQNVTGEVIVTCDAGVAYTVMLDAGFNSGGSFSQRRMRSGSGSSNGYNIYIDPARTQIWGDGTNNTYTFSGTSNGRPQRHTFYGHVPSGTKAPAGLYTDSLSITVVW